MKKPLLILTQLNECPFTNWVYQGQIYPHCTRIWARMQCIDNNRNVMKHYLHRYEHDRETRSHFLQQIYVRSINKSYSS